MTLSRSMPWMHLLMLQWPVSAILRRSFTHVDFVAKRHDSWQY